MSRRQGRRWTLIGVGLRIEPSSFTMVIGANGSGKTTLLRVLAGAWTPTRGEVRLFGRTWQEAPLERIALLSHADHHYDDLSAAENLDIHWKLMREERRAGAAGGASGSVSGSAGNGSPGGERGRLTMTAEGALARVGLWKRRDDPVRTFSAGMRKRLSFARVMMKGPELLLLDEPYSQLDPQGAAFVDGLFKELRESGVTVMVATHQVDRVAPMCDRAILMDEGRIMWEGASAEGPSRIHPGMQE